MNIDSKSGCGMIGAFFFDFSKFVGLLERPDIGLTLSLTKVVFGKDCNEAYMD